MTHDVGIIFPETPDWPKMRWVFEALESLSLTVARGHDASDFPRLSRECDILILGHKGISGRWPDLRDHFPQATAFVVNWWFDLLAYHDVPLADQPYLIPNKSLAQTMRACDLVLVKERDLIGEFADLGINAAYLDQGCPINVREVVRSHEPRWDVLIWGQGGAAYPERMKDAAALAAAGLRVAWLSQTPVDVPGVASFPWCHPGKLPEVAGQASLVLSCDRRHDVAGYCSDRLWMALGMGCAVLRRFTPGLPEDLADHALVYRDRTELVAKAKEILVAQSGVPRCTPAWSPAVLHLGQEARKWSLASHTLAHRCQQLLQLARSATPAKELVA